jgi:hypothetical protein
MSGNLTRMERTCLTSRRTRMARVRTLATGLTVVVLAACSTATDSSPSIAPALSTTPTASIGGAPPTASTPSPDYTILASSPSTPRVCIGKIGALGRVCAGWGTPGQLIVVRFGSSSCPDVAKSATLEASQTVTVKTGMAYGGPTCTADYSETVSAIGLPAGIDPAKPMIVVVDGVKIPLPARSK